MKKPLTSLFCAMLTLGAFAQIDSLQIDSITNKQASPLTDIQRDSVMLSIKDDLQAISETKTGWRVVEKNRFKVFKTENIYNVLKLDTATGRVTALQIGINNDSSRFEYSVCDAIYDYDWKNIGRFELYPTGNRYNFVLIDTIFGSAWQVQ